MQGIATIDRQPNSDTVAIWLTSRSGVEVGNTNAVVSNMAKDPSAIEKVRSLTRCCAVLVTEGSMLDGLPIEGEPLTVSDIAALVDATEVRQHAILAAIEDYKRRSRSKTLAEPRFLPSPSAGDFRPTEDTASQRAFTTANFIGKAWSRWLATDEERRRRTAQPKTGLTPWIMPADLNSADLAAFPAEFAVRLTVQPSV